MLTNPIKTSVGSARYWLIALITGVMAVSVQGQTATSSQGFDIFRDGQPTASILLTEAYTKPMPEYPNEFGYGTIPAGMPTEVARAVQEFQTDLLRGYGIKLPAGEDSGLANRIELDVKETTLLEEDNTSVTFPEPNIMRITGGQSGIMRTLFYILEEHAGVRYLFRDTPGRPGLGTHYPPLKTLTIPRTPFTHNSAFPLGRRSDQTVTGMALLEGANRRYYWGWEMKLGAKVRIGDSHTLTEFIFPMEKYVSKEQTPPTEIFPLHGGKLVEPYTWPVDLKKTSFYRRSYRGLWQPRYGQQATVDEAVKNILAYLKEHPERRSISLAVNDNGGFSDEENHKESESYWGWVNKVANAVTKKYPEMRFGAYAYQEVMNPPGFKINPNVTVYLTTDWLATVDPQIRKERAALISAWSKLATVGPYSYNYGNVFFNLPRIYTDAMKDMVNLFHDNGALSSTTEVSYYTLPEGPNMYVYFKLLENPELDVEKTIVDWCVAAVGKEAAPSLRDYYAFWETFWKTKAVNTSWWHRSKRNTYLELGPFGAYMYAIAPGDMERCRALLENVVKLAQDNGQPDQAARAQLILSTFAWHEAGAIAAGAQFISSDGNVIDSNNAVKLLQNIPNAQKAFEVASTLPETLPDWAATRITLDKIKRANPIPTSLTTVNEFVGDPQVIQALDELAKNKEVDGDLRFLARMIHANATGQKIENNMAPNPGLEEAEQKWEPFQPIHGSVSISTDVAFKGTHSLKFNVQHINGRIQQYIEGAKPETQYFFSAMVYVPESQKVGDRILNLRGSPLAWKGERYINRDHTRNVTDITLKPGKWTYVSCIIPGANNTEAIALRVELKNYTPGDVVYIDDIKAVPMNSQQD